MHVHVQLSSTPVPLQHITYLVWLFRGSLDDAVRVKCRTAPCMISGYGENVIEGLPRLDDRASVNVKVGMSHISHTRPYRIVAFSDAADGSLVVFVLP